MPANRSVSWVDEARLADRIARGDHAAFEALMRHHNGKLFRVARAILRDDAEAEDALQDAYLDAYRHMPDFRGSASLATWLTRIVINHALMRARKHKRDRVVVPFTDRGAPGVRRTPRAREADSGDAQVDPFCGILAPRIVRQHQVDRRGFLQLASSVALAAASGCAVRRFDVPRVPTRHFARVDVSPGRVIRTVVGLRPYRPSGFVLRAERLADKLLVHNYGHGGGGVTLSWGTARLAVDELNGWTGAHDRAAVVGCGAIGLATARLLQRRGIAVTIYAKDIPPNTTSNVAGAQWGPFSVFETGKTTPAFDDQFTRAARISRRLFQDLPLRDFGIRWIENYSLSDDARRPAPNVDLYPDTVDLGPREHPFPYRHARRFTTMLIETSTYMRTLLQDFLIAGGEVTICDLPDRNALVAFDEPLIFNCTGLGARALLGDEELIPAKGQVTFLLPQPEIDYITLPPTGLYMFPRSDGILLGGTFERGNWTLEPDRAAMERVLDGHRRFFAAMK